MSENKDLIKSKAEISSYLRAATEIEKDIYKIESMCDELENKAKKAENDAESKALSLHGWDMSLGRCYQGIEFAREECMMKMKPTNLRTDFSELKGLVEPIFGKVFWGTCIGLGVLGIILMVIGGNNGTEMLGVGIGVMLSGWLPSLIIAAIVNAVYRSKKGRAKAELFNRIGAYENAQNKIYNEMLAADYAKIIEDYKKEIEEIKKEIDKRKEKIKNLKEEAQDYRDRIKQIWKDAEPLYANRDRFYSVGIVPPDYRTIDCVYVLDQIFRNDLADTMRDAVLLYEERTFRGDLIRGINNIVTHMDKLSSLLSGLRNDIKTIKLDVTAMCDNMEKIYAQNRDYASASAQDRERLYEETKLHRFALEAIEESNKKIVDYIEK